jgi:tetratricopeptide (TPR) repeat protein
MTTESPEPARTERMKDSHFDHAAAAFRAYGIDLAALDADAAAERIWASAIKDQLVAALDDWARGVLQDDAAAGRRLLDVAAKADPDEWRNRFRDQMVKCVRKALEELARGKEVAELPPATTALLADALARAGAVPAAVDLLRRAQQQYPADFWLNHELASYLQALDPPRPDQAVGFYRAALALRPTSPGVHYILGNALFRLDKLDEAEAAYRRAIELQADSVRRAAPGTTVPAAAARPR